MNDTIIAVQGLCHEYPGFRALTDVNLRIGRGSVTALVGPNGAGKTTLLRCLAALDTPLAGTVQVAGLDVHEQPRQAHALMGFLSDSFGVYEALSVAQCLAYAARAQGTPVPQVDVAVQQTAQQLGLGDKLHSNAGSLSRGQRQRLAIGQAIIHKPQVLLLDEPASGLDPEARGSLGALFKALQAQGMTIVVSSHILAELDEYCTHMLAIGQGRVLEHRALGSASLSATPGSADARRLRLGFAQGAHAASAWLVQRPLVQLESADAHWVLVNFAGSTTQQAELVRDCVLAGHALTELVPVVESLQQRYLKTVAAQRALNVSEEAA